MKVDLEALNDQELHKSFKKLHRQFAHPNEKKLKELLKYAEVWKDEYTDVFHGVCSKCDVCKRYATTPPRPVVAMPLASEFTSHVSRHSSLTNVTNKDPVRAAGQGQLVPRPGWGKINILQLFYSVKCASKFHAPVMYLANLSTTISICRITHLHINTWFFVVKTKKNAFRCWIWM